MSPEDRALDLCVESRPGHPMEHEIAAEIRDAIIEVLEPIAAEDCYAPLTGATAGDQEVPCNLECASCRARAELSRLKNAQ